MRITRIVRRVDGRALKHTAGKGAKIDRDRTDWARVRAMSDKEVIRRARLDSDARPLSRHELGKFRRVSLSAVEVRAIRRRTGLSQATFAARYGLNLRTLQDWEQGRAQPDAPARAYLLVIDREPRAVARALAAAE
jgi:putative transcriptional regulator